MLFDALRRNAARLRAAGCAVVSGPRTTGDGCYESCVAGPEGVLVEITVQQGARPVRQARVHNLEVQGNTTYTLNTKERTGMKATGIVRRIDD